MLRYRLSGFFLVSSLLIPGIGESDELAAQAPSTSEQVRTYLSAAQVEGPYQAVATVYPRVGFTPRTGAELLRLSRQAALEEGAEAILLRQDPFGRMEVVAINVEEPTAAVVSGAGAGSAPEVRRSMLGGLVAGVRRAWNSLLGREDEPVELCVICGDVATSRRVITLAPEERWKWKPPVEVVDSTAPDSLKADSALISTPFDVGGAGGLTQVEPPKEAPKEAPKPTIDVETEPEIIVAESEGGMDKATLQSLGLLALLGILIAGRTWQKRKEAKKKAVAVAGRAKAARVAAGVSAGSGFLRQKK